MKCQIHDLEMEWMDNDAHPEGGFWACDRCVEEEEAWLEGQATVGNEPDYGPWSDPEEDPDRYCPNCGKEYEDWSDYGCTFCDSRVLEDN